VQKGIVVEFNVRNAILEDYLDSATYPPRLEITTMQPLHEAVADGKLTPDAELLTFEFDGKLMTFPLATVVCYNVIQGQHNDQPWMMTFCNACNAGMVFDPVLDGQKLRFHRRGSYNGLLLIWDDMTDTYWNHITGEAIHGALVGQQLTVLTATRHMTVAEALALQGDARVLITTPSAEEAGLSPLMMKMQKHPQKFTDAAVDVLVYEDTRLPRYTLGLGIWQDETSVFYPATTVFAQNNVVLTELDGRQLLIYQGPESVAPVAVFTEGLTRAHWQDDVLRLSNGGAIRNDQYINAAGKVATLERPMQLLMRWYGFALTFPGCAIGTADVRV
jgi:hypothetical protein